MKECFLFSFFDFLEDGKSMNRIKLLINNFSRKNGGSKPSLDFYDYGLTYLGVSCKDFDSCIWDYGARSLLALLTARGRSTETLKVFYFPRWFSSHGKYKIRLW